MREKEDRPEQPILNPPGNQHGNHPPQNVVGIVRKEVPRPRSARRLPLPGHCRLVTARIPDDPTPLSFTGLPPHQAASTPQRLDMLGLT